MADICSETMFERHCGPAFDRIEEGQVEILKVLNGNGVTGLRTLVDRHDQFISGLKKTLWLLAGAVISAILAGSIIISRG